MAGQREASGASVTVSSMGRTEDLLNNELAFRDTKNAPGLARFRREAGYPGRSGN